MRRLWMSILMAALISVMAPLSYAQSVVPAGTAMVVTLSESVSSKDAQVGQKVSGSIAEDVVVDGKTLIPKGAKANLSVANAASSGRLSHKAKLWLRIDSIETNDKTYQVNSNLSGQTGPSHNKRNVISIGGGAATGAVIGGIAGGGAGAAVGTAVGAGAGTVGAALTGKKDINYPAETKLRFVLQSQLTMS